jgi:hypothetical protein
VYVIKFVLRMISLPSGAATVSPVHQRVKGFLQSPLAVPENRKVTRKLSIHLRFATQSHRGCRPLGDRTDLDRSVSPYLNTFNQERKGGLTMQTTKNTGSVNEKSSGNGYMCGPLKRLIPAQK